MSGVGTIPAAQKVPEGTTIWVGRLRGMGQHVVTVTGPLREPDHKTINRDPGGVYLLQAPLLPS